MKKLKQDELVVLQLLWDKPNLIKREIKHELNTIGYSYNHTRIASILNSLHEKGYVDMVENYEAKTWRVEAVPNITEEQYYNQPEDKKPTRAYTTLGEYLQNNYRAEVIEVTGDKTFIIHGNYDKKHEDMLFETMKVLCSTDKRVYVERIRK